MTDGAGPSAAKAPSFELSAEDFTRAFERACREEKKKPPPELAPTDHKTLKEAANEVGLDPKSVDKALHRISLEKLPAETREKMGIVLEDDLPPESKRWVPIVAALAIGGLVIAGAFLFAYDPEPPHQAMKLPPQKGTVDVEQLHGALDTLAEAAEDCYLAALAKNKKLQGAVTLTVRIGLDGKAESASASQDELGDAGAVSCMVEAAKGQAYPRAEKAAVDVDVPFSFTAREVKEKKKKRRKRR